jgi:hypothetical protein
MKNINYRSFLFTGHVNDKKKLSIFCGKDETNKQWLEDFKISTYGK